MLTAELIDRLFDLREQKRRIEAETLKPIETEMEQLRVELIKRFQEEHTQGSFTTKATAKLTETVVPTVVDWDAFHTYVKENDAFYLLQKRVTSPAWLELHNAGETPPGTVPFTKFDVSLRSR